VPVAVKFEVDAALIIVAVEVIFIPVNTGITVRLAAGEVTPSSDAVTLVVPGATPVATPKLIVATLAVDAQVTLPVMVLVELSE
jgi:hypothetical protein